MTCFQDIVANFELTPHQVAAYLWRDAVFSTWDGDCEYLESLTPEQLKAFGELILAEASMKEEELADVA